MSLSRSASTASNGSTSSAGSSVASAASSVGVGRKGRRRGQSDDLLEEDSGLTLGAFGVLYTLAREKLDSSNRIAVLKVILDFLQIFILILQSQYGWDINEGSWIWKAISWVMFVAPIIKQGLLWGCADRRLARQHFNKFINFPPGPVGPSGPDAECLLQDKRVVKGAMKGASFGSAKLGKPLVVEGVHVDGGALKLNLTAMMTEADRVIAMCTLASFTTGDPQVFKATLFDCHPHGHEPASNALSGKPAQSNNTQASTAVSAQGFQGQTQGLVGDGAERAVVHDPLGGPVPPSRAGVRDREEDEALAARPLQQRGSIASRASFAKGGSLAKRGAASPGGPASVSQLGRAPSWDRLMDSESDEDALHGAGADDYEEDEEPEEGEGSETAVKDTTRVADYRQGKRYKQLVSLLSSKRAREELSRYQMHTLALLAMLVVAHIAVYVTMTTLLDGLSYYVSEVSACSSTVFMLQRVMIGVRSIANIYANNTNPMWYSMDALPGVIKELETDINKLERYHQGLFMGFDQLRRTDGDLSLAWEGRLAVERQYIDTTTPYVKNITTSLWYIGNQILLSSRQVLLNHADIARRTGNNLSLDRDFQYIILNGAETASTRYRMIMDLFIFRTETQVAQVGRVGLAMLVVEGVLLCMAAAVWTFGLLEAVSRRRYTLYKVFLVVPTALLRALAAKKVHVEGMDDDDDDADEEEGAQQQQQQQQPHGRGRGQHAGPAAVAPLSPDAQVVGNFKDLLVGSGKPSEGHTRRSLWQRVAAALARLGRTVAGTDVAVVGKKKLVLNGRDTLILTAPFVFWGFLVIATYATSYTVMHTIRDPLITLNVAGRLEIRVMRGIFAAHELVSATTPATQVPAQRLVAQRGTELYEMYRALLYGSKDYAALVWNETQATLFKTNEPAGFFFRAAGVCYVTIDAQRYCYTSPLHEFYQVSTHALDPMLHRLADEMNMMSKDALYDIAMNSTRFDYIFKVAYQSLADGLWEVTAVYASNTLQPIREAKLLHTIMFVASLVLPLLFLIFMFRTFINMAGAEAVQVAELLSYLPLGMDVEGLVTSVLMPQHPQER